MSAIIEKHIQCDGAGCQASTVDNKHPSFTIKDHRRIAKGDGWFFRKGLDLCSECKRTPMLRNQPSNSLGR